MLKFLASIFTAASILIGVASNLSNGNMYVKSYVLIEASTGRIVASQNEHSTLPIASTTKIMTALIALEQSDIYRNFTVDPDAIKVEGTSMGLREGYEASLYALTVGMLLPSGNDGANAAAVKIAGSTAKFADMMNQRAEEIGMKNTHFVTPSGLHDEEHYSSAYDMAILAKTAMKNNTFASICGSASVKVELGKPLEKRTYQNHNKLLSLYEGCNGVKTGFTKKAGRCLVSSATRNGVTLICVTLGASDDWNVHKRLLDFGFEQVKPTKLPVNLPPLTVQVVGGVDATIPVVADGDTMTCVSNEQQEMLTQEVHLNRFYYAPVRSGDVLGEVKHYLEGNEVATTTLVAGKGTEPPTFTKKAKKFIFF